VLLVVTVVMVVDVVGRVCTDVSNKFT